MNNFTPFSTSLILYLIFHPAHLIGPSRSTKNTSTNTRRVTRRVTAKTTLEEMVTSAEDDQGTTEDPLLLADPLLRRDFKFKRGFYYVHNANPRSIFIPEVIHTISTFDEKEGRTSETFDTPHFNISVLPHQTSRKLDFDYQACRTGSDRWTIRVEYDTCEYEVKSLKCTMYDVDSNLVNLTVDMSTEQLIVNRSYSGACFAKLRRLYRLDQFIDIPSTSTIENSYQREDSYEGPDMTEGEPPYVPDYSEND